MLEIDRVAILQIEPILKGGSRLISCRLRKLNFLVDIAASGRKLHQLTLDSFQFPFWRQQLE